MFAPHCRACATAVGVPDITATNSSVRWMYLMGGTKDTDNSTSCLNGKQGDREVYAYDTNLDTWTKLDVCHPQSFACFACWSPSYPLICAPPPPVHGSPGKFGCFTPKCTREPA